MSQSLVTLIAGWSDGSVDDQTLLAAFNAARQSLDSHQTGFGESVEALDEKQSEHCEPLIEFAHELLDRLGEQIEQGFNAVRQRDRNALFIAGDQIRRASFQLNQTFVAFRDQALLALGPTAIPNLNLLLSLQKSYQESRTPDRKAALVNAIRTEVSVTSATLRRVESEKATEIDLLPTLKRVLDEQAKFLQQFAAAVERDDNIDFFPYVLELQSTYTEIQRLLPAIAKEQQLRGETEFSDLNLLLKVMRDVSRGAVGDEPLLEVLENVEASFPKFSEALEERLKGEASDSAREEFESALETFGEFEEGIEAVYSFFESRDIAGLSRAREFFLSFASNLSESLTKIESAGETAPQGRCLMCGAPKQPGAVNCPKCKAPIINRVVPSGGGPVAQQTAAAKPSGKSSLLVTEQLAQVYTAVDRKAAGIMDDEDFLAEVQRFEEHIKASLQELPELPKNPDKAAQNQYEHFQAALTSIGNGTKLFKQFVADRDEGHLKEGVLDRGARILSQLGAGNR